MLKDRRFSLFYRLFVLGFTFLGIYDNLNFFNPYYIARKLMYFTMQSSILALVLMCSLIINTVMDIKKYGVKGRTAHYPILEKCCIVNLLLTVFIYWLVLLPGKFTMGHRAYAVSFDNLSVHLVIPILFLFDYMLFSFPKKNSYKSVYAALIYPAVYTILTIAVSYTGLVFRISNADNKPVHFPYNFLDYNRVGISYFLYIAIIAAAILLFSHFLFLIDRRRASLYQY